MEQPKITAKFPKLVMLEAGKYYWCACGRSNNQPFCDGSHRVTGFTPLFFEIVEKKEAWLCQCKNSKNKPFCDGTHKTL